jgi:hypothetical protein
MYVENLLRQCTQRICSTIYQTIHTGISIGDTPVLVFQINESMKYTRILLKLSGESLMGSRGYGIDPERLGAYARQVKEISDSGVQVAIVAPTA